MTSVLEDNILDRQQKEEHLRKDPSVKTPLPSCSTRVHEELVWFRSMLPLKTTDSDKFVIHPFWKRVWTLQEINFTSRSPTDAWFLTGSITGFTGILSHYSNMPMIPW